MDGLLRPVWSWVMAAGLLAAAAALGDRAGVAADSRFAGIERHALAAPPEAAATLEALAAYLSRPARGDLEKARAIYRWMAANLVYDLDRLKSGRAPNQTAEELLASRKGICGCYVNLYLRLAGASGLEAAQVVGYSKGLQAGPGGGSNSNLHAWVTVRTDGRWILVDPTWGSGYVDDAGSFVRQFNEYYFATRPEEFILTHFPLDPKFQQLEIPLTRQAFDDFVTLKPAFFHMGLRVDSHTRGRIWAKSDLRVTLRGDNRTALTAGVWRDGKPLGRNLAFVQSAGERIEACAVFPEPGDYFLRLFAKRKGQEGAYQQVLEYWVRAEKGVPGRIGFPEVFEAFPAHGARLYEPMTGFLKSGAKHRFKLAVPGASRVAVVAGRDWHHLKRGVFFEGDVLVTERELTVFAQFTGEDRFTSLLKYAGY